MEAASTQSKNSFVASFASLCRESAGARLSAFSSALGKNWNTMCKMGMRRDNDEALCGLRTPYREEPTRVEPEYFGPTELFASAPSEQLERGQYQVHFTGQRGPNHGTLQLHNNNVLSGPRHMEVYYDYITCRVTYLFRFNMPVKKKQKKTWHSDDLQ